MSHDDDAFAEQLIRKAEALKTCLSGMRGVDERLIAEYQAEIDGMTSHLVMVMQVRSEGEM